MRVFRGLLMSPPVQWSGRIFSKKQSTASALPDVVERKKLIFLQEQRRQLEEVGRVEQISVEISGPPEDAVLMMNQHISTPYDCCRHISEALCQRSPLALIDEKILWDMHRPLPGNCKLKFLTFKDRDPFSLNETFWRTGSLVLGAVILKAFKTEVGAKLKQFPECREKKTVVWYKVHRNLSVDFPLLAGCYKNPDKFKLKFYKYLPHPFPYRTEWVKDDELFSVNTGSFFYDIELSVDAWTPTMDELKVLSAEFLTFVYQNHKIERLTVNKSIALQIFEDNPYKTDAISKQSLDSGDCKVVLYKVGDHIDICNGPMVANTSFFGRATVTACHCISVKKQGMFRIQAVALPKGIMLNSFAYNVLCQRATNLNELPVPDLKPHEQFLLTQANSSHPINPDPDHFQF